MTKKALLDRLESIFLIETYEEDPERTHAMADEALLIYINDNAIREAYEKLTRWYQ